MKTRHFVLHAVQDPMEGVVNPGPHQIYRDPVVSIEERELGRLGDEAIRVSMMYAGVCGTDAHMVQTNPETGYLSSSSPTTIPPEGRLIGHEGVGRITAVGSHVRHIKANAYVTLESIVVCHHCDACRRGQFNQCRNAKLMGLEEDGLFGTIVDVPATLAHDVTEVAQRGGDKGLLAAACVEPAAVAYVGCQNTYMKGGDVVAVFGAGPIGLLAAILSESVFGAAEVHIIEPVEFRRDFARKWVLHPAL